MSDANTDEMRGVIEDAVEADVGTVGIGVDELRRCVAEIDRLTAEVERVTNDRDQAMLDSFDNGYEQNKGELQADNARLREALKGALEVLPWREIVDGGPVTHDPGYTTRMLCDAGDAMRAALKGGE